MTEKIAFHPLPMGTAWTIIVGIHICSLLFLTAYLRRLIKYSSRYTMTESKYTLLFGWINLPHIVLVYIITISLLVLGSVLFLTFSP